MNYPGDPEKRMRSTPSTSSSLYILLPYMWWQLDDFFLGYARTAGLVSDFKLDQEESEEMYTDTKFVLFAFTWLLLLWKTTNIRQLVTITTTIQAMIVFAQILAPSTRYLLLVRSLLGIGGAVFPGALLLMLELSGNNLATAAAMFVAVSPFEISVAGPVLSAIAGFLKDTWGLNWRAIFAFDGMLGLLVALMLWTQVFSSADQVLSAVRVQESNYWANWKRNLMGFFDLKIILSVATFICCNLAVAPAPCYLSLHSHISFAYMPYFFFTVFADMGPSHLSYNVLMIAPYFVSVCSIFIVARMSDKIQVRGYFVIICMFASALGFGIMSLVSHFGWNEWLSYLAIFPACIGCYGSMTITISWALGNERSGYKRGLVLTMLLGAGRLAALFSPAGVKPWWRAVDEPSHPRGLGACAALMAFGAILALALRTYLARRNFDTEDYSYAPVGVEDISADEVEDHAIEKYIL